MTVYILIVEDYGVMHNVSTYSTKAKALKALKAKMRVALKECTMNAEEKKAVRKEVDTKLAYDIEFDRHWQHAYIIENEVL